MKIFCESCHDMTDYQIKDEKMHKEIKGKLIDFIGKKAFCLECYEELFVEELHDFNLEQLDTAYRVSQNIITKKQIGEILEKYDIGKRPLSQLLGWGEITLTRYLEGALPTKQYSDTLLELLQSSDYMERVLEENRDHIAERTYNKCKLAIERLNSCSNNTTQQSNRIECVAKYLIASLSDITPLALQKLLYYTQGFYRAFYGEFLFEDDCEAWVHGPVYREVYVQYKDFGCSTIDNNLGYDERSLNLKWEEKELLDMIAKGFGCYSGKVLELMTHSEFPWLEARKGVSETEPSNKIIEKKNIENYFENVKNKFNMLGVVDIKDYSRDLFEKLF